MKKNKTMRAASVLLVLTLMTSCFVGGTFAKYTTTGEATDTARVAKFGVKIEAQGKTFATSEDNAVVAKTVEGKQDNVIAPGTEGEMAKMTLSGTPEVAVEVTYTPAFDVTGWTINTNEFYCPLIITVNSTDIKGLDYTSETDFEKAVNDAISGYSKQYAPNTDLSTVGNDSVAVSWKWLYEDTTEGAKQTNVKDTAIGDLETAPTVTLAITTTVTQLDTYTAPATP